MQRICQNCAAWKPLEDDDEEVAEAGPALGECRHNPPQIDPDCSESTQYFGVWPVTLPTDGCRKFEPKE